MPWFFYSQSFYFFIEFNSFYFVTNTKSTLCLTPIFFLPQFLLFLYTSQIHTLLKLYDFFSQISFTSLYYPNPYFIRPPSFFCLISFISLYNSNPYFVKLPWFLFHKLPYFFTNTKSILCLTAIFFLPQFLLYVYTSQIHTLFKLHDFVCPDFLFFFILSKSILCQTPFIFLLHFLYFSI